MKKTVIAANSKLTLFQAVIDVWHFRGLLVFLSWKDILVRYKQTVIGLAWSLLRPLITMVIFTVIFSKIANLPSSGAPYPVFVFVALLPWQFFSNSISDSSNSLLSNGGMISKIYFPRIIIPISAIIVNILDFIIMALLLLLLMLWYKVQIQLSILFLPLFTIMVIAIALGSGLWFSALGIKYRDFKYIVPFLMQMGLYLSPVGFSSAIVPEKWIFIYSLNPMVGVIDGFRWSIFGGNFPLYLPGFFLSIFITLLVLTSGLFYFIKAEKTFADIV